MLKLITGPTGQAGQRLTADALAGPRRPDPQTRAFPSNRLTCATPHVLRVMSCPGRAGRA